MFKKFILLFFIISWSGLFAQTKVITLSNKIYSNEDEIFHSHQGSKEFESTLAMNIVYGPINDLRAQLMSALNLNITFFTGWNSEGEAHITVVTPVEFDHVLKSKLSMDEIDAIAKRYDIQEAKVMIHGLGSAKRFVQGQAEETFFLIVDSFDLRNIRQQIFYEFVRRGGSVYAFDPSWFFPHITIGYTKRDFHESDGVIKNLKYSFDSRFELKIK